MWRGDPRLPFLDMARSPREMGDFFNRRVLPRVLPGEKAAAVGVEDFWYSPRGECVVLYELQLGDLLEDPRRWAVATFSKDDSLQEVHANHDEHSTGASSGPVPGPALYIPEYRCLMEFFPTDWKLPSLIRALDAEEITSVLFRDVPDAAHLRSRSRLQAKVLRHRPHKRCVLRYIPETSEDEGPQAVVGKVYAQASRAARSWHTLNTLYAQAAGVIIPKPLGLVKGWNLVLMECVPGTPMKQVLEGATSKGQAQQATRMAAEALARLHSLEIDSQELQSVESQLDELRKTNLRFRLVAPQLAEQVDALLNRLVPLARRSTLGTPSCIHGDCEPSQFLIAESQAAVVDFDRTGRGDAAVDVGNFMAALHREAVKGQDDLRELATYFLTQSQECSARNGLVDRARLFQVAALVRMALRAFQKSPYANNRTGLDEHVVLLLQEAAACLASL